MKLRLRLRQRSVEGISCPFPVVRLRVRDKYGALAELDFRVDTQADFTSIPVSTAQREGLPFSQTKERVVTGLVGETVSYRDQVRVVIADREHTWPCDFIKPSAPRESGQPPREMLPALGRSGFLDEYAITVDSGYLLITRIGPVRRQLRRWLPGFWRWFGLIHPEKQAL
jgi:hypothetical protein